MSDRDPLDKILRAAHIQFPGGHTDADFMREAASHIKGGYLVGGSGLKGAVIAVLYAVADALDAASPAPAGGAE